MATSTYPQSQVDAVAAIIAEAKTLTVERLKIVLRSEGLQVSGIKIELQSRVIERRVAGWHSDDQSKADERQKSRDMRHIRHAYSTYEQSSGGHHIAPTHIHHH